MELEQVRSLQEEGNRHTGGTAELPGQGCQAVVAHRELRLQGPFQVLQFGVGRSNGCIAAEGWLRVTGRYLWVYQQGGHSCRWLECSDRYSDWMEGLDMLAEGQLHQDHGDRMCSSVSLPTSYHNIGPRFQALHGDRRVPHICS